MAVNGPGLRPPGAFVPPGSGTPEAPGRTPFGAPRVFGNTDGFGGAGMMPPSTVHGYGSATRSGPPQPVATAGSRTDASLLTKGLAFLVSVIGLAALSLSAG